MTIVSDGVYSLKLNYNMFGEDMLNVFHYFQGGGLNSNADLLAQGFATQILPAILDITPSDVFYTSIVAEPVFDLLPEFTLALNNQQGLRTGSSLPTFSALSFRYLRAEKATRNGSKRFPGPVEQDMDDGQLTGTFFNIMLATATTLGTPINDGGGDFEPVILRKPDQINPPNGTMSTISGVEALDRITTQNSRKGF